LIELTKKVYQGRKATEVIGKNPTSAELKTVIDDGLLAEARIISYTNTLLTTMNTRINAQESIVPDPHPCSLDRKLISESELDNDYEQVINCVQRHTCRPEGYCKSKVPNKCRFHYPFSHCESTHIEFIEKENTVKAEIILERNDSFLNSHNRLACHEWRANTDMQIILDQAAAISYMVKYTTKGEKTGNALSDLYKSVIFNSKEDDNPLTKLRSVILKSVAGKRDLGPCEVSRLLFSEPLYFSSFDNVGQSLELNQSKQLNQLNKDPNTAATIQTLLDFYVNRDINRPYFQQNYENFFEFVIKFKVIKGKLELRKNPDKVIVVTWPKVHFNEKIIETYTDYCYYQMIKYSNWSIKDLNEIQNKETAIERWKEFIKNASEKIKNTIR
jgi:hypothetical protein